jgi:hypothetical protein
MERPTLDEVRPPVAGVPGFTSRPRIADRAVVWTRLGFEITRDLAHHGERGKVEV